MLKLLFKSCENYGIEAVQTFESRMGSGKKIFGVEQQSVWIVYDASEHHLQTKRQTNAYFFSVESAKTILT